MVAIALLAILLTTIACASVDSKKSNNTTPYATEVSILNYGELSKIRHIHKQIEVANGDEVLVTLLSNASTGFSWNENAVIADTSILQQLKHEAISAGSNIPGAPGAEKWNFKAIKAGTTTVHLEYSQPWEGGEKGIWTFDLAVTVK